MICIILQTKFEIHDIKNMFIYNKVHMAWRKQLPLFKVNISDHNIHISAILAGSMHEVGYVYSIQST